MSITVKLNSLTGANDTQRSIVERGCKALERAINHPEFDSRVRAAKFTDTKFENPDGKVVTVPPVEVLDYVLRGLERGTSEDNEIDLAIGLKYFKPPTPISSGTVGATTTGTLPFHTAYWFIDGCAEDNDEISPARHFMHEWMHVAGFIHYPNNKARDDVAYKLGEIVREILLLPHEGLVAAQESPTMKAQLDAALEEVVSGRSSQSH